MKFLLVLLSLLSIINVSTSTQFQCGRYACGLDYSCISDNGVFKCVYQIEELKIIQTVSERWVDSVNGPSVKVDVDVINHTHRAIRDIVIGTDAKLNDGQIWGAHLKGLLIDFPDYVSIAPNRNHSFGYINKGNSTAHLWVQHVYIQA